MNLFRFPFFVYYDIIRIIMTTIFVYIFGGKMSRRNRTNAVLGAIAIFSVCILLVIIAWHYVVVGGMKNAAASETIPDMEISGDNLQQGEAPVEEPTQSTAQNSTEKQSELQTETTTAKQSEEYQYSRIVTEFVTGESSTEEHVDTSLEQKYILVKELLQMPALPTGCEITSLTAVLNYWGYDVSKETMSHVYLEKGELGQVTAYEAFIGEPSTSEGYGCFAPVIVRAANKYLSEQNSFYRAYNLTGAAFEDLYNEINQNHPVIVWTTINMGEPRYYPKCKLSDGTYSWIGGEHCLVITGYNKNTNSIYVMDPLKGNVVYDAALFKTRYEQMFLQAVVIK